MTVDRKTLIALAGEMIESGCDYNTVVDQIIANIFTQMKDPSEETRIRIDAAVENIVAFFQQEGTGLGMPDEIKLRKTLYHAVYVMEAQYQSQKGGSDD